MSELKNLSCKDQRTSTLKFDFQNEIFYYPIKLDIRNKKVNINDNNIFKEKSNQKFPEPIGLKEIAHLGTNKTDHKKEPNLLSVIEKNIFEMRTTDDQLNLNNVSDINRKNDISNTYKTMGTRVKKYIIFRIIVG